MTEEEKKLKNLLIHYCLSFQISRKIYSQRLEIPALNFYLTIVLTLQIIKGKNIDHDRNYPLRTYRSCILRSCFSRRLKILNQLHLLSFSLQNPRLQEGPASLKIIGATFFTSASIIKAIFLISH